MSDEDNLLAGVVTVGATVAGLFVPTIVPTPESSAISLLSWSGGPGSGQIGVTTKSGRSYSYGGTYPDFVQFCAARSKGAYWNEHYLNKASIPKGKGGGPSWEIFKLR